MKRLKYGFGVEEELPFDQAQSLVTAALREEGFGVLTEIDVRKTMKEKLGAELPPYVILGVCNPSLAHRALGEDIDIGLLLPCNVVVRQENHATLVSVLDPNVMSGLSGAPGLKAIADEAHQKLEWALERAFDEYIE
jgi:uncharacterized protein (DUF302 family)